MKRNYALVLMWIMIMIFSASLWSAESKLPKGVPQEKKETLLQDENKEAAKLIIGSVEKVRIIPGDIVLNARIDTGAKTCSLGVDSYQIINEDGIEWLEMTLNGQKSKHKLVKYTQIKQHGREPLKRPVILLRLIIGDISESVQVTLADRSKFKYQLLIGRNLLHDRFIVDVSKKYATMPMPYEE
jgi:hypothetical protein